MLNRLFNGLFKLYRDREYHSDTVSLRYILRIHR
jgi:hypothetical protein